MYGFIASSFPASWPPSPRLRRGGAGLVSRGKIALNYSNNKLQLDSFNDEVNNILLGSKNKTTQIEAKNIVTIIQHVNKELDGFEEIYNELCEFTHPNWSGCLGSYGQINKNDYTLYLGKNIQIIDYPLSMCVSVLLGILEDTIQIYDEFAKINIQ